MAKKKSQTKESSKQPDDYMVIGVFFILGVVVGGFILHAFHSHDKGVVEQVAHEEHHAHAHEQIEVSAEQAPQVRIQLYPDEKSGVNVQLITNNFEFTPHAVNGEDVIGQGHAHIYRNGEKVARVYSDWFHIDAKTGDEIKVTLNTDSHKEYAVNGQTIQSIQQFGKKNTEEHHEDDGHDHQH